jgi:thioredoxin-like negative regulator of GroEL
MMKAAAGLQEANDVKFAWIDLTTEKEIAKQYPMTSRVPTITLFKAGEAVGSYTGAWIAAEYVCDIDILTI